MTMEISELVSDSTFPPSILCERTLENASDLIILDRWLAHNPSMNLAYSHGQILTPGLNIQGPLQFSETVMCF